ncbi:MAG: hypothetical protein ABSB25_11360 [Sedimentisphaerales bacterium]
MKGLFRLRHLLLYRLNPVLQVLNLFVLEDIFNNVFAGKPSQSFVSVV